MSDAEERPTQGAIRGKTLGRIVAEFLVIVVGVLVALGVDAWWSEREAGRLEREYLVALLEDVRAVRAEVDRIGLGQAAEMDRVRALIDSVRSGHSVAGTIAGADDPPLIVLFRVGLDTYADLQSAGGATIVEDPGVRRALATLAGQLDFNRTGEQWVLDIGLLTRASVLESDGPVGADRQEWALRSFLRAMELLQNARVSVGDAADAAERVLSAALE